MIVFNVQSTQKYSIMPLNSKIQCVHAFMKSRPYNAIVKVWIKAIVAALFKEKGHLQTKAYLTTYLCACQKSVSSSTISWELFALTRITCIAKMTIYVHYMSENRNISDIFFRLTHLIKLLPFLFHIRLFRNQSVQVNIV